MGAPSLKKKTDLHYRRGTTAHHCSVCDHYAPVIAGIGARGDIMQADPRCRVMGLKPGRAYRVNPNNICDAYDNSERLKRIRGY